MNEQTKKEEHDLLTEGEKANILKEHEELLTGWIKNLSPEESRAWLEAHVEDIDTTIAEAEREAADFKAVMQVVQGTKDPIETMESLLKKEQRTLAEAEVLDCYDRIKYKLIRLCYNLTPVDQRIVELLEARRTKTKADIERLLATLDPETLERWESLWKEGQRPERN